MRPTPELLALLQDWLPSRRWHPLKDTPVELRPWIDVPLSDPADDGATVTAHLLHLVPVAPAPETTEEDEAVPVLLHVPLVVLSSEGSARIDDQTPGLVGWLAGSPPPDARDEGGDAVPTPSVHGRPPGARAVLDGCHRPEFWRAWLAAAQWALPAGRVPGEDLEGAQVLSVEQSNTSVLLPGVAGGTVLKVLRAITSGANPDIEVPLALAEAGWDGVPRPYAWLEASGDTATGQGRPAPPVEPQEWSAQLGVLSQFVAQAEDGFRLACAYAAEDRSFAEQAADLGHVIAEMHAALRLALPVEEVVGVEWLRTELRRRAREALTAAPVLGARGPAVDRALALLGHGAHDSAAEPGPVGASGQAGTVARQAGTVAGQAGRPGGLGEDLLPLQRIHGDLHLGQTLYSAVDGWKVLDFEGEPRRPVAERTRPDLFARDLAGILRSFDYAAAVGGTTSPGWAQEARDALMAAYRETAGPEAAGLLDHEAGSLDVLTALELDKALYEVDYEVRSRPDWVGIPLAAVDRILASLPEH